MNERMADKESSENPLKTSFGDVVVNTLPHTPAQSIQSIVIC